MSLHVISTSKDGKTAQIVVHGKDENDVKTTRTHHVEVYKGQYHKRRVSEVTGKESIEVFE